MNRRPTRIHRLPFPSIILLVALPIVLGSMGCGGSFGEGLRAYERASYPEALADLQRVEREAHLGNELARARYALYRGLVHRALGDRESTLFWLGQAKRAADANPTLLDDGDAGRLESAWSHLPAGWRDYARFVASSGCVSDEAAGRQP